MQILIAKAQRETSARLRKAGLVCRSRAAERAFWPIGRAGTATSQRRPWGKISNFDRRAGDHVVFRHVINGKYIL
eukprot:11206785-Alexandrium_andersonii.AAC.1